MFTWRSLSAPSKVIALLIFIVLFGGTVYLTNKFVYGKVTVSSPQKDSYIIYQYDIFEHPTPYTYRLKPGRRKFELFANGYLNKEVELTVYPFYNKKYTITLARDLSYRNNNFNIEYDYNKEAYLIAPNVTVPPRGAISEALVTEWGSYNRYAQEALAYIKSQGVDPHSIKIEWWSHEYWPQGKSINY
jgi:hypothetical protein